jgi:tRNA pseudouridine13 synthase
LLYSALQSAIFNAVLAERVKRGSWATALVGDVLKKIDTGGLFVCTDEQQDRERAARGEISATGPIIGPKMMRAEGEVGALELETARQILGDAFEAAESGVLGDGTRRALRLFVSECRAKVEEKVELSTDPAEVGRRKPEESTYNTVASVTEGPEREQQASCMVEFVLPKGAFATTVLAHLIELN